MPRTWQEQRRKAIPKTPVWRDYSPGVSYRQGMNNLPPESDKMLETFVMLGWATRVVTENNEQGGSNLRVDWTTEGRERLRDIAALFAGIQQLYPFLLTSENLPWLKAYTELILLQSPPPFPPRF